MSDLQLTPATERLLAQGALRNPFMRALCEAYVIYQCEGKLDGFTNEIVRNGIRARLGEAGLERWDAVCKPILEALGETTDPGQLAQL